jgi:alkylated DNA repair dioxygenase AlkB
MLSDGVTREPFDHMLVNEYLRGQGIAFHRDYEPYGRTVMSLSLLSSCVMEFRHRTTGRKERLLLERQSLLVLSDEARYDWEHGIANRKTDVCTGYRWSEAGVCRSRFGHRKGIEDNRALVARYVPDWRR